MSKVAHLSKIDLARAIDVLRAKGETIGRVEIEPGGKFSILTGKPEATLTPAERWEKRHGRSAA